MPLQPFQCWGIINHEREVPEIYPLMTDGQWYIMQQITDSVNLFLLMKELIIHQ